MRDHGGNLDWAMSHYGGTEADWLDLSTGINPQPYPLPSIPDRAWTALPTKADMAGLTVAAQHAYGTRADMLPVAGAQAAIQMIPQALTPGTARVLGPTYNEHAAALTAAGWQVQTVTKPDELPGADLAVIVNPNNPDGRALSPEQVTDLARNTGVLVVDESFADPTPDMSVAQYAGGNLIVLRSFGKFYGLAGLRLGFVIGDIGKLAELAGPWPVSGAAIAIGKAALADNDWARNTTKRLAEDAARLDALAQSAGWKTCGGTTLFRLYETPDAKAAQSRLADAQIWSRVFPYSDTWLRLGLPEARGWARLETVLGSGNST